MIVRAPVRMRLLAVLLVSTAPAACSRYNAAPADDITGATWTLTEVNGAPVDPEALNRPATLLLGDDGRASGSSGCNQFGGSYTLEGDELHFGGIAMTRMACPAGMDVETAYSAVLEGTRTWRVTDDVLELLADEVVLARFRR